MFSEKEDEFDVASRPSRRSKAIHDRAEKRRSQRSGI